MNNRELVKKLMNQYRYLKHDEIIENSFSKFQVIAFCSCLIAFSVEGYIIYNLAYLNLLPIYNCFDVDGTKFPCDRHETCLPGADFEIKSSG
jgi:hypothetical protein